MSRIRNCNYNNDNKTPNNHLVFKAKEAGSLEVGYDFSTILD
jgi:hypothetical protein